MEGLKTSRRCVLAALVATALLVWGCVQYEDDFPVHQTEILRVEVEPDTVAVGGTARFTCVIRDSLDERFRFRWTLGNRVELTDENFIDWLAELPPDNYFFSVQAEIPKQSGSPPLEIFEVFVAERD